MNGVWRAFVSVGVLVVVLSSCARAAEEHVYIYPLALTPADKLSDGNQGGPIRIQGDTMLIWVDLHPTAKFAHATLYVLISAKGSRIVKGQWWPVLNGKMILYGAPKNHTVVSPFRLPGASSGEEIHVHVYPVALEPTDKLTDGPAGDPLKIPGQTMLVWVDLQPKMRFAHPTLHVLICGGSSIVEGQWWPVLNGRRILSGVPSNYTLVSPFVKESGGIPKKP
jgi:hypothetical protein